MNTNKEIIQWFPLNNKILNKNLEDGYSIFF